MILSENNNIKHTGSAVSLLELSNRLTPNTDKIQQRQKVRCAGQF
jgi:hypothetical protein